MSVYACCILFKALNLPAVSTIVIVPVKNGWLVEEIGTFAGAPPIFPSVVSSVSMVDRVIQDSEECLGIQLPCIRDEYLLSF